VVNAFVTGNQLTLAMTNLGHATMSLAAYPYHLGGVPTQHPVAPAAKLRSTMSFGTQYDVSTHGPNGFVFEATGNAASADIETTLQVTAGPRLRLTIRNGATEPAAVTVAGSTITVPAGQSHPVDLDPIATDHGWYDLTVTLADQPLWRRHYAGHLENGQPSRTG
jgi:phospholipase C